MPSQRCPAIFLDRDGVIIENRANYVRSVEEVSFIPGAREALAALAQATPCRIVIVTNQSAVGRGILPIATAHAINKFVQAQVLAAGGRLDGIYMCPHTPQDHCRCRKPAPGMLQDAAAALGLDLPTSVLVGDNLTDIQAAHAVGARALLVRTGLGQLHLTALRHYAGPPVQVVADLVEAVEHILTDSFLAKH